jgi:hypothetical protein
VALILRNNPAPLSGALFVKNPKKRRVRKNRKQRRAIKFRSLGGLVANRRRRVKRVRRNSVRRNSVAVKANRKGGVLARLLRKFKMKRNAGYLLNRRRRVRKNAGYMLNRRRRVSRRKLNPMKTFKAHGKTVKFFAKKNRRHAKRNPGYLLNRRRRSVRRNPGYQLNRRRNPSEGGFNLAILRPVENIVAKFPILGSPVAKAMGYVAFGALAGATHFYGLKAVRYVGGMLPAPVQSFGKNFIAPVGYSLTGVLANFAIQRLPIPFLSESQKKSLGIAAMIAGGVLDVFRALKGQSRDLGDLDGDDDFGDADDFGDGQAYDVVPLAGIGEGMGAIGEGMGGIGFSGIGQGMGDAGDYSDAEMADAYYSGPDLDGYEGEAALHGAHAYRSVFGAPAKQASRTESDFSRHAGKPGHRWGWLIKAVGWERFQAIAAMEPEARCALIEELRKNAIATVDTKLNRKASMGAIGEGMGGIGLSGIGQGFGGVAQGFGMVASEGMGDLGFMAAGSAY